MAGIARVARKTGRGRDPGLRSARVKNELEKSIQQLCLAYPEAELLISHGMPNYRVRGGKVFAIMP